MRVITTLVLALLAAPSATACELPLSNPAPDLRLIVPTQGSLASGFGPRRHPILGLMRQHNGADFDAEMGTPVRAVQSGRVTVAGRDGGLGNLVRVAHGPAVETSYAHLSRFAEGLKAGSCISKGDVIGYVGNTGLTSGPLLHFELSISGKPVDPLPHLAGLSERPR